MAEKFALTINEATTFIGLSRSSLYKLMTAGKIIPRKAGNRTLFLREELEAYMRSLPVGEYNGPEARE